MKWARSMRQRIVFARTNAFKQCNGERGAGPLLPVC